MGTGYYNLYVRQVVPYHFFKLPLQLISKYVVVPLGIIGLAVIPHKLNMIQHFLDSAVLSRLQLILYLQQIHGMLDDEGVVVELKFFILDEVHYQSTGWMN